MAQISKWAAIIDEDAYHRRFYVMPLNGHKEGWAGESLGEDEDQLRASAGLDFKRVMMTRKLLKPPDRKNCSVERQVP